MLYKTPGKAVMPSRCPPCCGYSKKQIDLKATFPSQRPAVFPSRGQRISIEANQGKSRLHFLPGFTDRSRTPQLPY
jgi:hypothetical protein